jgi:phospholipid/cholesterol/gamma-HCH transport system substrate-binding protein
MSRRHREGAGPLRYGVIALVLICIGVYLGFTKDIPFTKPFEVKAVFESANSIRANSPVRIAGVNVGKVQKIEPQEGGTGAVVTLMIKDEGLPVHEDASARIRPRIFLEGNFFVDLNPGSPQSPVLETGDSIKVSQTSTPVQLDEVLTALQEDTREDLQDTLDGLATALNSEPDAADDADADKTTRGETAAKSLNDSYENAGAAARSASVFNDALLGMQPELDQGRLLKGMAATSAALVRDESALQGLVTNLNATLAAFASEQANLRSSIRQLGPTLEHANTALAALNDTFPPTRAFAREILPGVRETPETIEASFPWIAQTRRLLGPTELRGLARELAPASADLARLIDASLGLFPQIELASRCATDVLLPTGDVVIKDEFETGVENYKEFWYTLVALSGESQNFDANGYMVRFQPGGGNQSFSTGTATGGDDPLVGNAVAAPLGTRPKYTGVRPPYKPEEPCHLQTRPDLNGKAAEKGPPDGSRRGAPAPTTNVLKDPPIRGIDLGGAK